MRDGVGCQKFQWDHWDLYPNKFESKSYTFEIISLITFSYVRLDLLFFLHSSKICLNAAGSSIAYLVFVYAVDLAVLLKSLVQSVA